MPALGVWPSSAGRQRDSDSFRASGRRQAKPNRETWNYGASSNRDTSSRETFVPPDRPRSRTVWQRAGRRVAGLDRTNRLRWLGRSQLGVGPEALRRRCRGQGLCAGAGRKGEETGFGNPVDRGPFARPGLGDEPSAKTLQFLGGESVEAYSRWRSAGNQPPRTDPFYVPPEVAEITRRQATDALLAAVRLAHFMGQLQDRTVPVSGFVGSPAHCWSHWFLFPPLPDALGGHPIPDVYKVSLELLVERFARVFQACLKYGTTFDLECHPSERPWATLPARRIPGGGRRGGLRQGSRIQLRLLSHGMARRFGRRLHSRLW